LYGVVTCSVDVGAEPGSLGFNEFIYKHIIPACFMAPTKPTFDLNDAQTVQVRAMSSWHQ